MRCHFLFRKRTNRNQFDDGYYCYTNNDNKHYHLVPAINGWWIIFNATTLKMMTNLNFFLPLHITFPYFDIFLFFFWIEKTIKDTKRTSGFSAPEIDAFLLFVCFKTKRKKNWIVSINLILIISLWEWYCFQVSRTK